MKTRNPLFSLLILGVAILGAALWLTAQTTSSTTKLSQAITLYNGGKFADATNLLNNIAPTEADYAAARCYQALCRFELKEYKAFVQAMRTPEITTAPIPTALREDLKFKEIAALAREREFESIFPLIAAFHTNHANSGRRSLVVEQQLSALLERGLKKTQEACATGDTNQFNKRWAEGKANLEQFLALGSTLQLTNYRITRSLRARSLQEDVWVARVILGDEAAAFSEIPTADTAAREKLSLTRVKLNHQLQPGDVDRNLELMGEHIRQFPNAASRKRVELDMAIVSFPKAKKLCQEADLAERSGDPASAAGKRAAAHDYFGYQRRLQGKVVADTEAGIDATELLDLNEDLLTGYHAEGDLSSLNTLIASLITQATPGDATWKLAKTFDGIALAGQPDSAAAAAARLDEVLASGFTGKPAADNFTLLAARWRFNLALKSGDAAKLRDLVQHVRDAECAKELKAIFLTQHTTLATTTLNR